MIWIELRTSEKTFEQGWNFSESVWAPTLKENGHKWPFWTSVRNVQKGDLIIHLRHAGKTKQFIGYSVAGTDGYPTNQIPTSDSYVWDYSTSFYKVDLVNYQALPIPIALSSFFFTNNSILREHYKKNKSKRERAHLFYTIQKGKLQCQFGAYFSELDEKLVGLLVKKLDSTRRDPKVTEQVETGETLKKFKARIGHQEFSANVKKNFKYQCCYPNCKVEGRYFLVGGHIDRWCDNEDLRGDTSNGICFCLMHDKAFERGYFTLDKTYRIIRNPKLNDIEWLNDFLDLSVGEEIKKRQHDLSIKALKRHWKRIKFTP